MKDEQPAPSSAYAFLNPDVFLFFDAHMDALPMYVRLEQAIRARIPDVRLKVSKTQISFAQRYGFAFVSFLPCRRAAQRPDVWMTVSFGLPARRESARIDAASEPYPGRWTHHVMIGSEAEIDEELLAWILEAAAFSRNKR